MITTIIMYISLYHRIKMCTAVAVTFTCKLHTNSTEHDNSDTFDRLKVLHTICKCNET